LGDAQRVAPRFEAHSKHQNYLKIFLHPPSSPSFITGGGRTQSLHFKSHGVPYLIEDSSAEHGGLM